MISPSAFTLTTAAGVLTHLGYFKHGEHHLYGLKYVQAFFGGFIVLNILILGFFQLPFDVSLIVAEQVSAFYLIGLYTSLLFYRIFFHPLNRFPGPILARVSNLWFSSQCLNADAHKQVLKLHREYNTDFLRIGSSDLSITHPQGVTAIYGNSSCIKNDWYDTDWPTKPLMAERDKTKHDKRRKPWSVAFSDKSLRGYQQRIRNYDEQLREQLKAFGGRPVNARDWFHFYAFDIMGDLAFGESFGNLTTGSYHFAAQLIQKGMNMFSFNRKAPFLHLRRP